jgi:DNA-binding NtrC family response regulator
MKEHSMSTVPIHILVVDDDEDSAHSLAGVLAAHRHRVEVLRSGPDLLERLNTAPTPDVCLLDVRMPGMDGIETLRRYRARNGQVPVVLMSAHEEANVAIQAMRLGATDFVIKPIRIDDLMETLERVVAQKPMRASTSTSVIQIPESATPQRRTLGVSAAMRRVEALIDRVADADVPILITGESGVGKDVAARELHARSSRANKVFVKINCAALPETLLESELFGYERGAFTGAQRAKPGQFELADGGTLFLDEIGEMPISLQAKLLQALQDGEFYRVGGQKKVKVDVRLVVATNRDLERAIRDQTFREDLYYRLNVVAMRIPPLRERRDDIPGLLAMFVERYGRRYGRSAADVPQEVVDRFLAYDFPGNVRELENLVRRLMVLRDPSYVYAEMRSSNERGPLREPTAPIMMDVGPVASVHAPAQAVAGMGGGRDLPAPPVPQPQFSPAQFIQPPPTPAPSPAPIIARTIQHYEAPPAIMQPQPPQLPMAAPREWPTYEAQQPPYQAPRQAYPFSGFASPQAARPIGEVVAEEFAAAGEDGRVDLKALGRKAAEIAEREAIVAMLARTGGSKREAADRLGISYKAILYKIREFGIGRPRVPRKPVPLAIAAAVGAPDSPPLVDAAIDEEDLVDDEMEDALDA